MSEDEGLDLGPGRLASCYYIISIFPEAKLEERPTGTAERIRCERE